MNPSIYYITRWKVKGSTEPWRVSTMPKRPTFEQAELQLKDDTDYFYNDIELQLVRVEETVLRTSQGTAWRGK